MAENEVADWASNAIFDESDKEFFPDVGIFLLPSGEGVRAAFRHIRSEHEATRAIDRFVSDAYLVAHSELAKPSAVKRRKA